ncbi:MAG TPA: ATP-binding protein [Solirubrobacteraceae bacterium]|nr:ATP-binding protein [Solirubrobacteraceae bacterium]
MRTVGLGRRLTRLVQRLPLPRRTIRLRLALLYGGLFFISGAALLSIIYTAVSHTHGVYSQAIPVGLGHSSSSAKSSGTPPLGLPGEQVVRRTLHGHAGEVSVRVFDPGQHGADLRVLAVVSLIALAVMAAVSMALGWLVAGRVLRPLSTITSSAREISATDLHRRLALTGPDDEFKELGDTFDGLLGRLDASFQAQRQFVANASHELRTPLARLKTLAQLALADPNASVDSLRAAHERVLVSEQQLEDLIEALLDLASGERGLGRREPVELGALTGDALARRRAEIEHRGLRLHATLARAPTEGSPPLLERLVANLLDNAIRHNTAGGRIDVSTASTAGAAVLSVSNDGPVIPEQELERLSAPFQRLHGARTSHGDGHGLGLPIVHAIATAHAATVTVRSQPNGGLEVQVRLPVRA